MKIKQGMEKDFATFFEVNGKDNYSRQTRDFAIRWAELMEPGIENGVKIEDIADKMAKIADADIGGITGFMYGCAVSVLSQLWEYGEQLNLWHNGKYGYTGDGTVNPSIFKIKT